MAFYLIYRFEYTGEMEENVRPNFGLYQEWLHWKTCTTGNRENRLEGVGPRTYGQACSKLFKHLGINSDGKFAHYGRKFGPFVLEKEEVRSDEIRRLGMSFLRILAV